MNTEERKLKFIQEFIGITDEETIGKLEKLLLAERNRETSEVVEPHTLDELNTQIDLSEMDFRKGRFVETDDLLKTINSWE